VPSLIVKRLLVIQRWRTKDCNLHIYIYIYIYISVYEHMCIIKFIVLMCLNLQVQRLYFIVRNSYEVSVLRIKIALAEHDTSL